MSITGIVLAAVIVGGTGLLIGLFLGFSAQKFYVPVDEKEEAVAGVLPGNNCGGCGYAGCGGLAAAIAKGEAPVNACPVGGAAVAEKISEIMGVEAGSAEKMVAHVNCAGTCDKAKDNFNYVGLEDCNMATFAPMSGGKGCSFGCIGLGSCVKACAFDAIHINEGHIAEVDREECVACGKCISACPKHLIDLVPYSKKYYVTCSSQDKGATVMKTCSVGCIGCKKCEKACKFDAIHVENNVAKIDYDKCKNCGLCAKECPKGIIFKIEPLKMPAKKEA
ncbi:MAG: RnfABCDGE type electron transport complex subunit B [Eubacterium sp.]|nr:RnfABCDGE type electron transport complex subunit B [Eubacterium sp.]